MQQILTRLKEPKLLGTGGSPNRTPPADRKEYERARQVSDTAMILAEEVVKQGMGDRFPKAIEILKLLNVPLPDVQPSAIPHANMEHGWEALAWLVDTLEQHGDRLPIPVIKVLQSTRELLDGKAKAQVAMAKPAASPKPYRVEQKRGEDGRIYFAVVRKGRKAPLGTFELESEAESSCESLNSSPVAVLKKIDLNRPKRSCSDQVTTTGTGSAEQFPQSPGPHPPDPESAPKEPLKEGAASEPFAHPGPGSEQSIAEEGAGKSPEIPLPDRLEQASEIAPAPQLRRKRGKRLPEESQQPLGSATCNSPVSVTSENVKSLEPTPPAASGDSGYGALPAPAPKASLQADLEEPPSGCGAEPPTPEAAGGEQPEAAGARGGEPANFSQGDWVSLDPACRSLARFERHKGSRLLVTRYNKKPNEWLPKPTLVDPDKVRRRLSLQEVCEKFPGAHEAWLAVESQRAMPVPAPCPPSETVYEAFSGGAKVMKVTVTGESGDAPRLKFIVCSGEQAHPYATLEEAKAACERIAAETPDGGARKRPASPKPAVCPPDRGPEGGEREHETLGVASVQGSAPVAEGRWSTPPETASAERRRRKIMNQRKWRATQKQARLAAQAAAPAAPQGAGPQGTAGQGAAQPAAAPMTDVPAGQAPAVSLVESRPVPGMGEAGQNRNAQLGAQQLPPSKPIATAAKPFRVKKRTTGDITDFAVTRDGGKAPFDVFDTESEAKAFCDSLNAPRVAGIVPQEVNPQPAAESAE
jgi:hypothetical protein